jgi:hypothetical protein
LQLALEVEPGDLLALADGPPLRVTVPVQPPGDGEVGAIAEVVPVALDRHLA